MQKRFETNRFMEFMIFLDPQDCLSVTASASDNPSAFVLIAESLLLAKRYEYALQYYHKAKQKLGKGNNKTLIACRVGINICEDNIIRDFKGITEDVIIRITREPQINIAR